jgi:hypothetical protein
LQASFLAERLPQDSQSAKLSDSADSENGILYKTKEKFLLRLGLKDVNELPSTEKFREAGGRVVLERSAAEESSRLQDVTSGTISEQLEPEQIGAGKLHSLRAFQWKFRKVR